MRKESTPKRNIEIDALRSFAILYIVGFWHLYPYYSRFTYLLTYCVLGLFLYISGLLLSRHYRYDTCGGIFNYYKRRFFRIYPLFFISLTVFLMMGIIDKDTYFKSAFLTNMILPTHLMTLWFIAMISIYYLISPLFLYNYSFCKAILFMCLCWAGLVIIHSLTGYIDLRLPMYLLPFVLGLMTARSSAIMINSFMRNRYLQGLCGALFLVALWQYSVGSEVTQLIIVDIAIVSSIPLFVSLSSIITKWLPSQLLEFISYASLVMYLSHKILFALSGKLYHSSNFLIQVLYYGCFVLPATIILSFFIQLAYDKLITVRGNHDVQQLQVANLRS
jgi:peptidoglycan/LPS O-acetylase OafA/YrhL